LTAKLNPVISQQGVIFPTKISERVFFLDIILAGFNIDYETIKGLKDASGNNENLTPETISAAYARISRNPLPVNELREIARKEVEKARRSNKNIVFDMGHSSIAEHAVFNIDVIGISRLIVEEIEKFRLCSYTEKSQRYIRLENDFVIPEEIRNTDLESPFIETIREQNKLYHTLYAALENFVFEKHSDMASEPKNRSTLEGWAKEDARYIVSLATEAQLGMTINARNLELMLRRSAAHPLKEVNKYGRILYDTTKDIAPSLVRYTEPTPFDKLTRNALKEKSAAMIAKWDKEESEKSTEKDDDVTLVYATPDADNRVMASIMHASSSLPMERCAAVISGMKREEKEAFIKTAFRYIESYDPPVREFENVDLLFEIIVSATCFAQMKRHRMATIISQDYDPSLGVMIPPAIREVGLTGPFMETVRKTEEIYERIREASPAAAAYILTNAHRKRVAIKVTARELYHISRLREDRHAQWDIRETARKMLSLGKKIMPLTLMMATGKDGFASLRDKILS
jgi:flavin-dependent thymidylate synthase